MYCCLRSTSNPWGEWFGGRLWLPQYLLGTYKVHYLLMFKIWRCEDNLYDTKPNVRQNHLSNSTIWSLSMFFFLFYACVIVLNPFSSVNGFLGLCSEDVYLSIWKKHNICTEHSTGCGTFVSWYQKQVRLELICFCSYGLLVVSTWFQILVHISNDHSFPFPHSKFPERKPVHVFTYMLIHDRSVYNIMFNLLWVIWYHKIYSSMDLNCTSYGMS